VKLWSDGQLSPVLCPWLQREFRLEAVPIRDVGLLTAEDEEIFDRARGTADIVMTKDRDFVGLVERRGPPPCVIWITVGNTSNRNLKRVLSSTMPEALAMIEAGEKLVEISDAK
jgi:predicted nuclease of predicted toxin-antitoxin system